MELLSILLVALMIEAVVETVKPLWKADGKHLTAAEIVSILIGMLVAVTCKINMLAPFVALDAPVWVEYIFYALTGIALGRGPSFVHDLWTKINEWSNGNFVTETVQTGTAYLDDEDLNIENWSLPMLRSFYISLTDWNGFSAEKVFIGLSNYKELANDPSMKIAIVNTLYFMVLGGIIVFALSIWFAYLMSKKGFKAKNAYSNFFYFPNMISPSALAVFSNSAYIVSHSNNSPAAATSRLRSVEDAPPRYLNQISACSISFPAVSAKSCEISIIPSSRALLSNHL